MAGNVELKPATFTLWQGDCIELMKNVQSKSVDLILCDLPYGTTKCPWDEVIPFDGLWEQYTRVIKDNGVVLLFGQEPFASFLRLSNIGDYKYDIYWEKERLTNINQVKRRVGKTVETISVFYKKQCTYNPQMVRYDGKPRKNRVKNGKMGSLTDQQRKTVKEYTDTGWRYPTQVWKFQRDCLVCNLHPTQKPVALLEKLIKTFTNEDGLVLDSCMGSGSTGVACMNTGRRFIGMELDQHYFETAKNRISEASGVIA